MGLCFLVIAVAFGSTQRFLCRTKLPGPVKWFPMGLALAVFVVCWMRILGWIALPATFYISKSNFFQFPDFVYVMLWALAGILGSALGVVEAKINKKP